MTDVHSRSADSVGAGAPASQVEISHAAVEAGCLILSSYYMDIVDCVDGVRERVVTEIIREAARVHQEGQGRL